MQKSNDKNSNMSHDKKHRGFTDMLRLPSDALFGETRIELRGLETMFISGCRRILKYSTDDIRLLVKGHCINISGCGLICTTYHYGTVTVEGCISSICFEVVE